MLAHKTETSQVNQREWRTHCEQGSQSWRRFPAQVWQNIATFLALPDHQAKLETVDKEGEGRVRKFLVDYTIVLCICLHHNYLNVQAGTFLLWDSWHWVRPSRCLGSEALQPAQDAGKEETTPEESIWWSFWMDLNLVLWCYMSFFLMLKPDNVAKYWNMQISV